jgi:selenide,water dikinase
LLAGVPAGCVPPQLLAGAQAGDDAAVYRVDGGQAIVAAADYFTPLVDDPFDFGAIAATAAISRVYAKGATPLFALPLVGMPVDTLPVEAMARILEGGAAAGSRAGIPVAAGHPIDAVEPIYGLVVIGTVNPEHLRKCSGARPGDRLVLGKPLGIGAYATAHKRGHLGEADYRALLATATLANTPGPLLACLDGVHAMSEVAGFGLLGHLLPMCAAGDLGVHIEFAALPHLSRASELIAAGFVAGASARNWVSYGTGVRLAAGVGQVGRALLTDPQTSGGLLVACAPEAVTEVLSIFLQQGFSQVATIGEFVAGEAIVDVG